MAIRVEKVEGAPTGVPEGTLGYGPNGWQLGIVTEIIITLQGYSLREAMYAVEINNKGLLGEGDIVLLLKTLDGINKRIHGFVVFLPEEVKGHTFGKELMARKFDWQMLE